PRGKPGDALAALSDDPIDPAPLRKLEADVRVAIGGVRVGGFEVGKIDFTATGRQGVVEAALDELRLYGGNVTGRARLDGSGKAIDGSLVLDVDRVDIGRLARAATRDEPPVAGIATARVDLAAAGASPRRLVQALTGTLAVDLGKLDVKAAPAGALTALKANATLQGLEGPPSLRAEAIYNRERLEADLALDPLKTVLGENRFRATLDVRSAMLSASYRGWIQQAPVPGLDGRFEADVPSVGKLAAWLGRPLAAGQPDPGPLAVQAVFKGGANRIALEQATLEGKAVRASASGSYDGAGLVPSFKAAVVVEEADLDAYLPPPSPAAKPARPAAAPAAPRPTGWSEEPLDLSALAAVAGEGEVRFRKVRYRGLVVEEGEANVRLARGILDAATDGVRLADGTLSAASKIDTTSPAAAVSYRAAVAQVQARPVLKALADTDRLSGRFDFEATGTARGRSQKELVESLAGQGRFRFENGAIHGINIPAILRRARTLGLSPEAGVEQKTDFTELGGTFTITGGVLDNRDFALLAPLLRMSGAGTVPLPARTVDYGVQVRLVSTLEGAGGQDALAGLPIPVRITGPWDALAFDVDWQSVFREMARDPERLRTMPAELQRAARGLGIDLPIPRGPAGEALPGLLRSLPLAPRQQDGGAAPVPSEAPAGEAAPAEPPAAAPTEPPADLKDTLKRLRGLVPR
ncbi:MAG: AsmA-like C-terminal region-containing protein, partial [Rhodospirillales bacterium]